MKISFMWKTAGSAVRDCPALYRAPGGYVVQGAAIDDDTRAQLRDVGPGETAVFVPPDVIDRITASEAGTPITEEQFGELLSSVRTSAFRLETRDAYALDYEMAEFERFLAGHPAPPPHISWWRSWLDEIAEFTRQGKQIRRVRILAEPPTAYQRWLLWAAPWYAQAGEDIRYVWRSTAREIGLPDGDWWLLDDERLVLMGFDEAGRSTGKTLVTEPERVATYRAWRDLAVQHSIAAEAAAA